MQEYKTLKIENIYNINDINHALPLLNSSGINTFADKTNIILNFDAVDIKLLETIKYNPLIQKTIEELYKIRSFSSSNGKIIFKSFNNNKYNIYIMEIIFYTSIKKWPSIFNIRSISICDRNCRLYKYNNIL